MHLNIRLLPIFILLLITLSGCDLFTEVNDDPYPTKIFPLSESELEKLQSEFNSINEQNFMKLDKYGFANFSSYFSKNSSGLTKDYLVNKARNWLYKNKNFTGVYDTAKLNIDDVLIDWVCRVRFKDQNYNGYKVVHTPISLWIDNEKVYQVDGHWYKYINVPTKDNFTSADAKEKVIGTKITWYDFGGKPQIYIVTSGSFYPCKTNKVIYPKIIDDVIELRVVWEIPIGADFPEWNIYFDSTTGEIVEIEQLFMT